MVRNSFTYADPTDGDGRDPERERKARERRACVDAALREDGVPAWRRPRERAAYERLDARLQDLRARRDAR